MWRTKIPLFKKTHLKDEKRSLPKNNKNVCNDTDLWKIFDFSRKSSSNLTFRVRLDSDPFSRLLKLMQVISALKIKNLIHIFTFEVTYPDAVMKVINNLNDAKSYQMNDILTKFIKINKDTFRSATADHL